MPSPRSSGRAQIRYEVGTVVPSASESQVTMIPASRASAATPVGSAGFGDSEVAAGVTGPAVAHALLPSVLWLARTPADARDAAVSDSASVEGSGASVGGEVVEGGGSPDRAGYKPRR